MNRLDRGSWTEANAGRHARAHADEWPTDREYAEEGPAPSEAERAESDAYWGGDAA